MYISPSVSFQNKIQSTFVLRVSQCVKREAKDVFFLVQLKAACNVITHLQSYISVVLSYQNQYSTPDFLMNLEIEAQNFMSLKMMEHQFLN